MRSLSVCKAVAVSTFVLILGRVSAQDEVKVPDGVCHVKLPPGQLRVERAMRDNKPFLRVRVGKTIVEAQSLFIGDGIGAVHWEAVKDGIRWVPPKGGKGFVMGGGGGITFEPGHTIGDPNLDFIRVPQLKAGSIYLTTPSLRFEFGPQPKP